MKIVLDKQASDADDSYSPDDLHTRIGERAGSYFHLPFWAVGPLYFDFSLVFFFLLCLTHNRCFIAAHGIISLSTVGSSSRDI